MVGNWELYFLVREAVLTGVLRQSLRRNIRIRRQERRSAVALFLWKPKLGAWWWLDGNSDLLDAQSFECTTSWGALVWWEAFLGRINCFDDMSKSLVRSRKLDLVPTVVGGPIELTTTAKFELITKKFQHSDQLSKMQILKKLKEVASSSSKIS